MIFGDSGYDQCVVGQNVEMTLWASGCDQYVWAVGMVTGSSGCSQWVGPVGVVNGCGQWVVDILFTS